MVSGSRSLAELFSQILGDTRQRDTIMTRAVERSERRPGDGRQAAARKAHARGIRLLKENLSSAQRAQYEKCSHFDVVGGETGRRYRIRTGTQMNVHRLDRRGRPVCVLCFMPQGDLVVGDVMLAQKLALELFESQTLKVANTFSRDSPLFNLTP